MSIKNLFSTIIILITSLSAQTQTDSIQTLLSKGLNNANFFAEDSYYARGARPRTTEGSVFLDEHWTDSRLLTPDNQVVAVQARYRLLDEEMQIKQGTKTLALYPDRIRAIALGNRIFIPLPYQDEEGKTRLSYFELLVDGDTDLLLHRSLEWRPSDYNPALQVGNRNDLLVQQKNYYYRRREGRLQRLKTTKPGVLSALNRRRKAVAAFAREEQLSPRKEKDLIRIFHFYNRTGKE